MARPTPGGEAADVDRRQRLLLAAERMIATKGFDVPASEILAASGHRNKSAIEYHFGSRQGMVDAIWYLHSAPVNLYRADMVAQLPEPAQRTTRQLIDAYLKPIVVELRSYVPSYWARFNERQLLLSPFRFVPDLEQEIAKRDDPQPLNVLALLYRDIEKHLIHLSADEASERVALTFRFVMHGLACWEREAEKPQAPPPDLDQYAEQLSQMAIRMLEGPPIADAKRVERYARMDS